MDADIKFLYDKRKIYISKEICEKLKYITRIIVVIKKSWKLRKKLIWMIIMKDFES